MRLVNTIGSFSVAFILTFFLVITYGVASDEKQKTLNREMDPVVVSGEQCLSLKGKTINSYGLYAFQKEKLVSIPFQIDELDTKGNFVLTGGIKKYSDEDKEHFDSNDQLVFMAKDTGDKLMQDKTLPDEATGCIEITVVDPVTADKGWVYLMVFPNPPEGSAIDYVTYKNDETKINALNYSVIFNKKHAVAARDYAFGKGIGGDGKDFLDRVKVRITMKQILTINRTEEDVKVKELGYIDGPVRVVVRTSNKIPLFLGMSAAKTKQNTFYYYGYADFPFAVDMFVIPSYFHVYVIDDYLNFKGWTFFSDKNPDGHTIDGIIDDSDKKLDLSPWQWTVVSGDKLAFWSRVRYPKGCPVKAHLYFNDDMNGKDKLEDANGELPGIGYDFRGEDWDKVERFPIEFRFMHFFTKAYVKGDEKEVVNTHDQPLRVSVKQF